MFVFYYYSTDLLKNINYLKFCNVKLANNLLYVWRSYSIILNITVLLIILFIFLEMFLSTVLGTLKLFSFKKNKQILFLMGVLSNIFRDWKGLMV